MKIKPPKNSNKKLITLSCLIVITSVILISQANLNYLVSFDFKSHIKMLSLDLKYFSDNNYFLFFLLFLLSSIIWIGFIGIATPILLISSFIYGYLGCIFSFVSILLGSTLTFALSRKFEPFIIKIISKKKIKKDQVFLYTILRLIPGVPFIMKNILSIFFNLNFKNFLLTIFIADFPQIVLFTFFFKRLIETSEFLFVDQNYSLIFDKMFLPTIFIIFFLLLIYLIKEKSKIRLWIKKN